MTKNEIIEKTNNFLIEDLEIDANLLRVDARLKEDIGIDSLDFVDIVVIVEKIFGYKIKSEEMGDVRTLGQFYDYLESKVR